MPVPDHPASRGAALAAAAACAAVAFALNHYVGRAGYMALDQSIVFDGGWRILNGQLPWRDFVTPHGLWPMVLQAGFFAIGGVSWTTYVSHASLMNAAAAAAVLLFLHGRGLPLPAAVSVGLATAVWMYPLMGTPYMDQHSLLFAGAAVMACWHAATRAGRSWWIAGGVLAALALLSKQVPAVAILPLAAVALLCGQTRPTLTGLALTVATATGVMALAVGALLLAGASWAEFVTATWYGPLEVGRQRAGRLTDLGWQFSILHLVVRATTWALVALIISAAIAAAAYYRTTGPERFRLAAAHLLGGLGLLLATGQGFSVTFNSETMLLGWVPLAAGLLVVGVLQLLPTAPGQAAGAAARVVLCAGVAAALLTDAVAGYRDVALPRLGNDIVVSAAERAAPMKESRLNRIGFSLWKMPAPYVSAGASFETLLAFFEEHEGNLLLLGDETILYGLTGRPSTTPFLWFHPGVSFAQNSRTFERLETRLEAAMRAHRVRWIVVPAHQSWMGWTPTTWVSVRSALERARCEAVGLYSVCEVAEGPK